MGVGSVIIITSDLFISLKFIVGKKNIYLTTNRGRLFLIDIENGKTKKILKIDNGKISRPLFLNDSLYIAKDDSIIKLQ